jgi:hypothetical protein
VGLGCEVFPLESSGSAKNKKTFKKWTRYLIGNLGTYRSS